MCAPSFIYASKSKQVKVSTKQNLTKGINIFLAYSAAYDKLTMFYLLDVFGILAASATENVAANT